MAIMVNIEPSELTVVRYVRQPDYPPSLVITDGSAAVWCCPHNSPAGLNLAAEFADRMVTAAAHWRQSCRQLTEPARKRPYLPEEP